MALDATQCAEDMYEAMRDVANDPTEEAAKERLTVMIQVLFDHISTNATIGSLDTMPVSGPGVHSHPTVAKTGVIS